MRENKLQEKCINYVKKHYPDVLVINIHGGGWNNKGIPDLILCLKGYFIAFELKVKNNKQSLPQKIWQQRINKSGGKHHLVYNLNEFKEIIDELYKNS